MLKLSEIKERGGGGTEELTEKGKDEGCYGGRY
jgi:hypothetical protein